MLEFGAWRWSPLLMSAVVAARFFLWTVKQFGLACHLQPVTREDLSEPDGTGGQADLTTRLLERWSGVVSGAVPERENHQKPAQTSIDVKSLTALPPAKKTPFPNLCFLLLPPSSLKAIPSLFLSLILQPHLPPNTTLRAHIPRHDTFAVHHEKLYGKTRSTRVKKRCRSSPSSTSRSSTTPRGSSTSTSSRSHSNVSSPSPRVYPPSSLSPALLSLVLLFPLPQSTVPNSLPPTDTVLTSSSPDLEWKLTYVGSALTTEHDQELESLLVGPIPTGVNKFIFEADPPNVAKLPSSEVLGVTVVLLTCAYDGREFVRVGYYVNNEYDSEELMNEPPKTVMAERLVRNMLAEKPRVTRFAIKWYVLAPGAVRSRFPQFSFPLGARSVGLVRNPRGCGDVMNWC